MKKKEVSKNRGRNQTYDLDDYREYRKARNQAGKQKKINPYLEQAAGESFANHSAKGKQTKERAKRKYSDELKPEERRKILREANKPSTKKKKKPQKRQSTVMAKRIMVICLGVMISYGVVKLIDFVTYPAISYQPVRRGVIDNTQLLEGVIIREEEVVRTQEQGDVHYVVGDGEKVAKGGDVCFITDDNYVENTLAQIDVLDQSIYSMQDKRNNLSYFQSEIHELNLEIADEMKNLYHTRYWENPHMLYHTKKELERTIQSRTSIYMEDQTEVTEGTQEERKNLQEQLRSIYSAYKAEESGIVSYQIDYLEEVLEPEMVKTMTYADYKALGHTEDTNEDKTTDSDKKVSADETKNTDKESSEEALKSEENQTTTHEEIEEKNVAESKEEIGNKPSRLQVEPMNEKGYPLYKIIKSYDWQIVTYMDLEEAQQYEQGKTYPLYINNHVYTEPIMFKLTIKEEEGKRVKLVFETNDKMGEFLDKRFISFSIGKNKETGLKIPLKSVVERNMIRIPADYIVEENNVTGVYRQSGEESVFIPIEIEEKEIIETKEYVLILQEIDNTKGIQLGQTLKHPSQQQPHVVNEIETVQGVYTINASYANFKQIKILMTNDDYAILSSDSETQLKEFDQIISNPKHIKEEELVRYMNIQN